MLDWRDATAQDTLLLSAFRCTYPPFATFNEETEEEHHDFPFELEVQRHLGRLRPKLTPPGFLFLGFQAESLIAVIEFLVTPFDRYCFIPAVAIAHSHSGNGYAREAIERVQDLMHRYDFADEYVVEALIDKDNYAAKSAFTSAGFEHLDMRNAYEVWVRRF